MAYVMEDGSDLSDTAERPAVTDDVPTPAPVASAKKRRRWLLPAFAVLGIVLVGGYALAYVLADDKLPRNTTVAGVDVSSESPGAATERLSRELQDKQDRDIKAVIADKEITLSPQAIGLTIDYPGSVDQVDTLHSLNPVTLFDHYFGSEEYTAAIDVNDDLLNAEIDKLTKSQGKPPKDGQVNFVKGKVKTVAPKPGAGVDPDEAREELSKALLSDSGSAELEISERAPAIDEDDVKEAVASFADPAMSGPVTLNFAKSSKVELTPEELSPVLKMQPKDGVLEPALKIKALNKLMKSQVSKKDQPVAATVDLVNGKPKVIPGKPGVKYDPKDINDELLNVVGSTDNRELDVPATVAKPDFTTKDAKDLQIVEKISSFTTEYPHAAYRNTNIGRAAELIDGTLLKPGDTFSMNGVVGERTAANGFTKGFIIANGIFKEDYGGSVSQMATTLYNAGFFGGMTDVEHRPHSFYIDRYPVGREATVVWGALDMAFKNETPYGVLVKSSINPSTPGSQGSVTVTLYSKKYWDIKSKTSNRYNYTSPGTRYIPNDPDCYPNSGYSGFDVDVTRIFRKHGESEVAKTEKIHTTYTPSDTVVCGPEPKPNNDG